MTAAGAGARPRSASRWRASEAARRRGRGERPRRSSFLAEASTRAGQLARLRRDAARPRPARSSRSWPTSPRSISWTTRTRWATRSSCFTSAEGADADGPRPRPRSRPGAFAVDPPRPRHRTGRGFPDAADAGPARPCRFLAGSPAEASSCLIVPPVSRARPPGRSSWREAEDRPFDLEDRKLVEDLAGRAAIARVARPRRLPAPRRDPGSAARLRARSTTRSPTRSWPGTSRPARSSRSARTSTSWSHPGRSAGMDARRPRWQRRETVERLRVDDFMAYYRSARGPLPRDDRTDEPPRRYPAGRHVPGAGRALRRLPLGGRMCQAPARATTT